MARSCGSCTLCCRVMKVPGVKDDHAWCSHAKKGACGIYDTRPELCRQFNCQWLMNEKLGPHWFPKDAKIVVDLKIGEAGAVLAFIVDPNYPDRWKENPWWPDIRALMGQGIVSGMWSTVVMIKEQMIVLGR